MSLFDCLIETLSDIFTPQKAEKSHESDAFLTDKSENMEKLYKYSKELFDNSILEVERADQKINHYLVILNLFFLLYGAFLSNHLTLIKGSTLNLLQIAITFLLFINALLLLSIIGISLFSLKQITMEGHPTTSSLSEAIKYTEKDFWENMFQYYYNTANSNFLKIMEKKSKIKLIENTTFCAFLIGVFTFVLYVTESFFMKIHLEFKITQ